MPSLIGYSITDRNAGRPSDMIPCEIELSDVFNQITITESQRLWLWISSEQGERIMMAEHVDHHAGLLAMAGEPILMGDLLEPINAVRMLTRDMVKQCGDMIAAMPVLEDERPNRGVRRQQHRELFRQGLKTRGLRRK